MNYSVLQLITAFIFGYKYYANIVWTRGTERYELSSFIFTRKEDAERHKRDLEENRSFQYVETITFRSRNIYPAVNR